MKLFLFSSPYEELREAQRLLASRIADCTFHQTMRDFYADQAAGVDPHAHWNEFANLKQAWYNHLQDWGVATARVNAARTEVQACMDAYLKRRAEA